MSEKCVRFYDSLSGGKIKYGTTILSWVKDECKKLGLTAEASEGWTTEVVKTPQQRNGVDCGVFTIAAAEMVMLGSPMLYDQAMMDNQRTRFAIEILKRCSESVEIL